LSSSFNFVGSRTHTQAQFHSQPLRLQNYTPSYMKFSVFPVLVAGAGLAQLVSASPIRITVTELSSSLRFGHAVANSNNDNAPVVAHIIRPGLMTDQDNAGRSKKPHRHSCGGSLRNKAIIITNTIRKALGMSLIEEHPRPIVSGKENTDGLVRILPIHFIGTPSEIEIKEHHYRMKHHQASFMRRMHHALTALGPWEGRAVAFVLGCGIGVLLRMVWVMCIITYRLLKGGRDEDAEYEELIFAQDPEELVVPPPQYTDEKVKAADDKAPVTA